MKPLTPAEQEHFNYLHIELITADKCFRNWGELSEPERIEIINTTEVLAKEEFLKLNPNLSN
jgi:hypothetical protein